MKLKTNIKKKICKIKWFYNLYRIQNTITKPNLWNFSLKYPSTCISCILYTDEDILSLSVKNGRLRKRISQIVGYFKDSKEIEEKIEKIDRPIMFNVDL